MKRSTVACNHKVCTAAFANTLNKLPFTLAVWYLFQFRVNTSIFQLRFFDRRTISFVASQCSSCDYKHFREKNVTFRIWLKRFPRGTKDFVSYKFTTKMKRNNCANYLSIDRLFLSSFKWDKVSLMYGYTWRILNLETKWKRNFVFSVIKDLYSMRAILSI